MPCVNCMQIGHFPVSMSCPQHPTNKRRAAQQQQRRPQQRPQQRLQQRLQQRRQPWTIPASEPSAWPSLPSQQQRPEQQREFAASDITSLIYKFTSLIVDQRRTGRRLTVADLQSSLAADSTIGLLCAQAIE